MLTLESAKLKNNLLSLENGYYISKNDPLFWKKLLIQRPEDPEAMYQVGLETETQARNYLMLYNSTQNNRYLMLHQKLMKQTFELISRSFNKGFLPARSEVLRLERLMRVTEEKITSTKKKDKSQLGMAGLLMALVIALLLGVIVTILFLTNKLQNTFTYANHYYAYMLPYEVIDKKPAILRSLSGIIVQPKIIVVKKAVSKELLVSELVDRLKTDYQMDSLNAIKIMAIDETKTERGVAFWAGGSDNIQVYIYPPESIVDTQEHQLWETTTVIRSAAYQFLRINGYLPKDLGMLTQPFPDNYLTALPNDPYLLKNTVSLSSTGEGGWLYRFMNNHSDQERLSAIKEVVKPNVSYDKEIPFYPLSIIISKENHTLSVISGDQIIRNYSVALGKEDSTPEGDLFISKKVMNPDKFVPLHENVYGNRAMELSNNKFAIHGTNSPSSIGQDVSQGCIRLNNSEMEDLYAITPLYTPVKIEKNPPSPQGLTPIITPNDYLYNQVGNSKEEDTRTIYHWAS